MSDNTFENDFEQLKSTAQLWPACPVSSINFNSHLANKYPLMQELQNNLENNAHYLQVLNQKNHERYQAYMQELERMLEDEEYWDQYNQQQQECAGSDQSLGMLGMFMGSAMLSSVILSSSEESLKGLSGKRFMAYDPLVMAVLDGFAHITDELDFLDLHVEKMESDDADPIWKGRMHSALGGVLMLSQMSAALAKRYPNDARLKSILGQKMMKRFFKRVAMMRVRYWNMWARAITLENRQEVRQNVKDLRKEMFQALAEISKKQYEKDAAYKSLFKKFREAINKYSKHRNPFRGSIKQEMLTQELLEEIRKGGDLDALKDFKKDCQEMKQFFEAFLNKNKEIANRSENKKAFDEIKDRLSYMSELVDKIIPKAEKELEANRQSAPGSNK